MTLENIENDLNQLHQDIKANFENLEDYGLYDLTQFESRIQEIQNNLKGYKAANSEMSKRNDLEASVAEISGRISTVLGTKRKIFNEKIEEIHKLKLQINRYERDIKKEIEEARKELFMSGESYSSEKTVVEYSTGMNPPLQVNITLSKGKFESYAKEEFLKEQSVKSKTDTSTKEEHASMFILHENNIRGLKTSQHELQDKFDKYNKELDVLGYGGKIDLPVFGLDDPLKGLDNKETEKEDTNKKIKAIYEENLNEYKRIFAKINTYEDIMKLPLDELRSLNESAQIFDEKFQTDFKKAKKLMGTNDEALAIFTQLSTISIAFSSTKNEIENIFTLKGNDLYRLYGQKELLINENEMYEKEIANHEQRIMICRYVLGDATERELDEYNKKVKDESLKIEKGLYKTDRNRVLTDEAKKKTYAEELKVQEELVDNKNKLIKARKDKIAVIDKVSKSIREGSLNKRYTDIISKNKDLVVGMNALKPVDLINLVNKSEKPMGLDTDSLDELPDLSLLSPTTATPEKGEPEKGEPEKGEPAKGEPAKSEPEKSEPEKGEPAITPPAGSEESKKYTMGDFKDNFTSFMNDRGWTFKDGYDNIEIGESKDKFVEDMLPFWDEKHDKGELKDAYDAIDPADKDAKDAAKAAIDDAEENVKIALADCHKELRELVDKQEKKDSKTKDGGDKVEGKKGKPNIFGNIKNSFKDGKGKKIGKVLLTLAGLAALGGLAGFLITGGQASMICTGFLSKEIIDGALVKKK